MTNKQIQLYLTKDELYVLLQALIDYKGAFTETPEILGLNAGIEYRDECIKIASNLRSEIEDLLWNRYRAEG